MSLIGETKLALLCELRNGPSYGYELAKKLDISSGYVYIHLDELQEAGMIDVVEEEAEGRQKKIYELTSNGEILLEALDA